MAKKEYVKLTPEGLRLLTIMHNNVIAEGGGFYQKEVFFTEGFKSGLHYLFQALGNLGAYARNSLLDKDVSYIIISNKLLDEFDKGKSSETISYLESLLNEDSSPYRRVKFISENHLVWYLELRSSKFNDIQVKELVQKYKNNSSPLLF